MKNAFYTWNSTHTYVTKRQLQLREGLRLLNNGPTLHSVLWLWTPSCNLHNSQISTFIGIRKASIRCICPNHWILRALMKRKMSILLTIRVARYLKDVTPLKVRWRHQYCILCVCVIMSCDCPTSLAFSSMLLNISTILLLLWYQTNVIGTGTYLSCVVEYCTPLVKILDESRVMIVHLLA